VRLRQAIALLAFAACGGSSPSVPARPDFRGGTVYEIFVRSFADSDGDGIGDLRGLTAHVDYLADLGVDAVWLMPTFPSPSYHGYDVTDYRGVNPQYGTLADMDAFVAAAHERGIAVVLDFVLNHASSQHPWFVDSASGPASARRDAFNWKDSDPHWSSPLGGNPWHTRNGAFFYGIFCDCMPDWNLGNAAVAAELTDAMTSWLARGIDGFRLDAVRYYFESGGGPLAEDQPATHAFLKTLRAALAAAAPKMVLVAEAWAPMPIQASYYGAGDEVQLAFSFDLADAVKTSAASGDASTVINTLAVAEQTIPDRTFEAPFLSNHDQVRVLRTLGGDAAAARVAAATLFALPGTPFVYYGEEIGMQGGAGGDDRNKRTPFRWTAAAPGYGFTTGHPWNPGSEADGVDVASEQTDPHSLLNLYKSLIALRRAQAALLGGEAKYILADGGGAGVLALLRGGGKILFVANFGAAASGAFTVAATGAPATLFAEGLAGAPTAAGGTINVPGLAPRGFAYLTLN
jgi:glycosidase